MKAKHVVGLVGDAREKTYPDSLHYFASTAFGWSIAPTRAEAIAKVARQAGADIIKRMVKSNNRGLYVWTVRVLTPHTTNYSTNSYAPEFLTADDKSLDVRVPMAEPQEFYIVSVKGAVIPKERGE